MYFPLLRGKQYELVALKEFAGRLLLVGVNYDKKTKRHECRIERWGESLRLSLSKRDLVTKLSRKFRTS